MVCNVVRSGWRSWSREVGKALGYRSEIVDRMARSIDAPRFASRGPDGVPFIGEPEVEAPPVQAFADLLTEQERARWPPVPRVDQESAEFARRVDIDNGGMRITERAVVRTRPTKSATMV